MKKRYIIESFCISLFLLFVSSCITDNKNSEKRVLSTTKARTISDLIDTLRYVSLYNDTVPFSGKIDKIMSKGDTLYIFDAMISKSLRAYSKDGRFLFNVGVQGRGPGEYIEMMNFTIDNKYFYCVDNAKQELLIYDINNANFIKEISMPDYADDIARFDNGDFIFYLDGEPGDGKIFITDENLKIIDQIYRTTKSDYCVLSTKTAFTQTDDLIIFSRYAKDEIVLFDKKRHENREYLTVDFGNDSASPEDKQDIDLLSEKRYLIPPVYSVNNMLIGNINLPLKQTKNDFWRYGSFAYDLENDQFYTNNRIEDLLSRKLSTDAKFILPFNSVVDDEIVAILDSYVKYDKLLELGFPAAAPAMKEQFNNGETLLVLYKLN